MVIYQFYCTPSIIVLSCWIIINRCFWSDICKYVVNLNAVDLKFLKANRYWKWLQVRWGRWLLWNLFLVLSLVSYLKLNNYRINQLNFYCFCTMFRYSHSRCRAAKLIPFLLSCIAINEWYHSSKWAKCLVLWILPKSYEFFKSKDKFSVYTKNNYNTITK